MSLLTMPTTPAFRDSIFGLQSNTEVFRSPLDGSVQTLERPGARWHANYAFAPMTRADVAVWQAFLAQLRGGANRFKAYDPDATSPRGTAAGTPLVNGASQTGGTLIVDGWDPAQTTVLAAGDYIAFTNGDGNLELHMVIADAEADTSGEATLTIEPPIRVSPANNAAVTVSQASCEMMLVDDGQAQWQTDRSGLYTLTFSGIEVFT